MGFHLATESTAAIGDFEIARSVAEIIEVLAIVVIAVGVVFAITSGFFDWFRHGSETGFETFKRLIARGLLIGLDLLIAADVIKTVTLEGTIESLRLRWLPSTGVATRHAAHVRGIVGTDPDRPGPPGEIVQGSRARSQRPHRGARAAWRIQPAAIPLRTAT